MKLKQMVGHDEIMKFVADLYNDDLHAKRWGIETSFRDI